MQENPVKDFYKGSQTGWDQDNMEWTSSSGMYIKPRLRRFKMFFKLEGFSVKFPETAYVFSKADIYFGFFPVLISWDIHVLLKMVILIDI